MLLALVRHGRAVNRDKWHKDDHDRPLTSEGADQAAQVFKLMRPWVAVEEVWTSPWTRARQTAEIASDIWKLPLREVPWLAGGAEPAQNRRRRLAGSIDIALIGHEPDLGELLGVLIGAPRQPLKKAGMALLEGDPQGTMELRSLLGPKLVIGVAGSG